MLSKQLLIARLAAGKTQLQVADHLQVSYATYSGYERGRRRPKPDQIRMMADFLGVSTDFLLETDTKAAKKKGLPVVCKTDLEIRLINAFRSLDFAGKTAAMAAMNELVSIRSAQKDENSATTV